MGRKTVKKQQDKLIDDAQIKDRLSEYQKPNSPNNADLAIIRGMFRRYKAKYAIPNKAAFKPLKTKDQFKNTIAFLYHHFKQYHVPKFLDSVWKIYDNPVLPQTINMKLISDCTITLDVMCDWWMEITSGKSFHKEFGKEFFTRKESHEFVTCPYADFTVNQAIVYAIAKAHCDNKAIAHKIALSSISLSNTFEKYTSNFIKWLTSNMPSTVEQISDLFDYVRHNNTIRFNVDLSSMTKRMKDWHYALARLKRIGNDEWVGQPISDSYYITKNHNSNSRYVWFFTQIKTARKLQEEGTAQRHCVFSYKSDCIAGHCSIWSLTVAEVFDEHETEFKSYKSSAKRKVTIELRKTNFEYYVAQERGYANRNTTNQEHALIKQWVHDIKWKDIKWNC